MYVEVAQSSKPSTRRSKKRNQKSQHLKKTKKLLGCLDERSENGVISESEVTGTVASKFGGPRIAKEHVSDTTNYPTPRPRTRNLKELIAPSTFLELHIPSTYELLFDYYNFRILV
ncbi:hypothetical protein H5410_011209 [Solanum commersonii]|uniref:Uncharacterized protein n=1 Tax=Solanum commersonii TaxID=4109 RepID=A0A9J6API6_SOLCO|nr:hypothetical protein H5410_011209 [Solanum commersonii]